MDLNESLYLIRDSDIYLIDQILKGRYQASEHILDAGAGGGRNLPWFFANGIKVTCADSEAERQALIQERHPDSTFDWATCDIAAMPFPDAHFDHIICNAVLHFAQDELHFRAMWKELCRVLKPKGSLFIRSCSSIGMNADLINASTGLQHLPDDSYRFLMDRPMIDGLCEEHGLHHLEAVKSTDVDGLRVMTTLILVKS